jgi:bifunctional DNase/RNase
MARRIECFPDWLAGLLVLAMTASAAAREPTVGDAELVLARYVGVAQVPGGAGAAVALSVEDGETVVPIFIGLVEAAAIARAERGVRPPRPLTHELLTDLLAASGGTLVQVVIDDLRDGIYYASVQLRVSGDRLVWVDARPSDALALAVRHTVPIRLGPTVIASAPDPDAPPDGTATLTGIRL